MEKRIIFASDVEVERGVWAFRHTTLPGKFWTHEAHLTVGLWHQLYHSDAEALRLVRNRIRDYNEACGLPNTAHSGYHETLTQFYLKQIRVFLSAQSSELPLWVLANRLLDSHSNRELPMNYYSREALFSEKARREWVEPDLL